MPGTLIRLFEEVISDACERVPELSHIDPDCILVLTHRMRAAQHGQNLGLRHARRGPVYEPVFPTVTYKGRDIRYVLSFNPRIVVRDLPGASDPLETVLHELWHVGTQADGTIRRMRHGKGFNSIVKGMVETYHRNGGANLPAFHKDETVRLRYWKARRPPSIAYLPRHRLLNRHGALAKIGWQELWTEVDLTEKSRKLGDLIPRVYCYVCPSGHAMQCHVRFRRPRSCALCSPRFDPRFLYRRVK